jgi:Patatin-like phospholipase
LLSISSLALDPETRRLRFDWEAFETILLNLATHGILRLVGLLVFAYLFDAVGIVALLLLGAHWLTWLLLATGGGLHLLLITFLLRRSAFAHSDLERRLFSLFEGQRLAAVSRASVKRFLRMISSPPQLRSETLNLEAFAWRRMNELRALPSVYLTAVDLGDGREKVFTQGSLSGLDPHGVSELWENRSRTSETDVPMEVAQAVAASTAIPPIFRPVHVYRGEVLAGVFVDGGVADNLAINVPKAFAAQVRKEIHPGRYGPEGPMLTFKDRTRLVLVLDGSKPMLPTRRSWRWLLSFPRVLDAMTNQHVADAKITVLNFSLSMDIPAHLVSLQEGVPGIDGPEDQRLGDALRRVRTHLDAFSLEECAALAYCGYALMDGAIAQRTWNLDDFAGARWVPPAALEDILPACCGAWSVEVEQLCRHLQHSNRRSGLMRWLGRSLGI